MQKKWGAGSLAIFHQIALKAEDWLDAWTAGGENSAVTLDPYIGYSDNDTVVARGRLLAVTATSGLKNFISRRGTVGAQAMSFFTNDAKNVEIRCGSHVAQSDDEGYFRLEVPRSEVRNGTLTVTVPRTGERRTLDIALTPPEATRMVISDIDDTVIKTGAWRKWQNFWRTMTTGVQQREVFQDTVSLIKRRMEGGNPVFYVSSSPWNLHDYLSQVFEAGGVPRGPMFLKDFGIDRMKFVKSSHGDHKGRLIDHLLEANPGLDVTLVGDTGQQDGEIYLSAIKRHPDRIREVFLRQAGKPGEANARIAEAIRATGVVFHTGERFEEGL